MDDFKNPDEFESDEFDTSKKDNEDNDKNNDDDEYENYCYMCRRPESDAGKLLQLSNGISICSDCLQKAFNSINNMPFIDLTSMPNLGPNSDSPFGSGMDLGNMLSLIHISEPTRPLYI